MSDEEIKQWEAELEKAFKEHWEECGGRSEASERTTTASKVRYPSTTQPCHFYNDSDLGDVTN